MMSPIIDLNHFEALPQLRVIPTFSRDRIAWWNSLCVGDRNRVRPKVLFIRGLEDQLRTTMQDMMRETQEDRGMLNIKEIKTKIFHYSTPYTHTHTHTHPNTVCMPMWACMSVVLLVAFTLNLYSFREICDFFIIFLPDELRALVYLAGLEWQNNVTRLLVHLTGHLAGTFNIQKVTKWFCFNNLQPFASTKTAHKDLIIISISGI